LAARARAADALAERASWLERERDGLTARHATESQRLQSELAIARRDVERGQERCRALEESRGVEQARASAASLRAAAEAAEALEAVEARHKSELASALKEAEAGRVKPKRRQRD